MNRESFKPIPKTDLPTKAVYTEEPEADNRPLVLFAAIDSPMYSSEGMVRGFEENGFRVRKINWQNIRFLEKEKGVRERLIMAAMEDKPALIFLHIQTPDVVDEITVKDLQSIAPVINYTFDVRKDFSWMTALAPHITYTLASDYGTIHSMKGQGINNVGFMPCSADYDWYRRLNLKDQKYYGDIVFVGNDYTLSNMDFPQAQQRKEMVEFLQDTYGYRFRAYGMNQRYPLLHPQEEILAYNNAKIAITHNNFYAKGYQSDRAYRSMGCGVATMMQYFPDMGTDFNSHTCGAWMDLSQLKEGIDSWLGNDRLRLNVADSGHDYVRKHHTWTKRFEKLKVFVKKQS